MHIRTEDTNRFNEIYDEYISKGFQWDEARYCFEKGKIKIFLLN